MCCNLLRAGEPDPTGRLDVVLRPPVRVCFVCSGNICRSPTAEVVLTATARATGRADLVRVDSAGTGDWHVGDEMDERSHATLRAAGYDVPRHAAKQFAAELFADRDVVVALDSGHRRTLRWLADQTAEPAASAAKIVLLREFDPELAPGEAPDVADPYYGGTRGFEDVLAQVERSCARLLDAIAAAVAGGTKLARPAAQQTESPPR
jgi:protein-tyrosine phosphatase